MVDIVPELLEEIQKLFKKNFDSNKRIGSLLNLSEEGKATYEDAQDFAYEVGNILADVFKDKISSDILPDGRMFYNIAKRILEPTLENNHHIAADYAVKVQDSINKKAKIGIKAVESELNKDKIDGLVDIVSEKEYDKVAYMLDEPVVNFTQTVVDDTVKANAKFHYEAGLSPKIRRISTGKCCEWCNRLAGIYNYKDVANTGNDVFRRHKNCRCVVEFFPGKGKAQNVHTKKIYSEKVKEEKSKKLNQINNRKGKDVKYQYFNNAIPRKGKIIIKSEEEYNRKNHEKEIITAELIHNILGGDIELLPESKIDGEKMPDYLWNGKYWDLKSTTTEKSANSAIRSGIKQIEKNPGGIILNYENHDIDIELTIDIIEKRMSKGYGGKINIMIVHENEIKRILRY